MRKRSLVIVMNIGILAFALNGCVSDMINKVTGKEDIGETSDGKSESSIMSGALIGAGVAKARGGDVKDIAKGAATGVAVGIAADIVNSSEAKGEKKNADKESANKKESANYDNKTNKMNREMGK